MKTIHYVMVGCLAAAAGLPRVAEAFPPAASPWMMGAAAVLTLVGAVLGAVSPSATSGASS